MHGTTFVLACGESDSACPRSVPTSSLSELLIATSRWNKPAFSNSFAAERRVPKKTAVVAPFFRSFDDVSASQRRFLK